MLTVCVCVCACVCVCVGFINRNVGGFNPFREFLRILFDDRLIRRAVHVNKPAIDICSAVHVMERARSRDGSRLIEAFHLDRA